MSSLPSPNSEGNSASAVTRSGSGSKTSDSESNQENHPEWLSTRDSSKSPQARKLERTSGHGTLQKPQPLSTACNTQGRFLIRFNGGIGQEILNADGETIVWTTDPWVAQVICKLLTENEGLLG